MSSRKSYYIGLIAKNLDKKDVVKIHSYCCNILCCICSNVFKTIKKLQIIMNNILKDFQVYFLKLILRKL